MWISGDAVWVASASTAVGTSGAEVTILTAPARAAASGCLAEQYQCHPPTITGPKMRYAAILGIAVIAPAVLPSQEAGATDSARVVAAIEEFHARLAQGDSAGVLAMIAPDAVVLESGAIETRDEYHHHHLGQDIEFARAVPSTRRVKQVTVKGDVAWVASTSETKGTFNARAIDSTGAELVILTRHGDRWMISGIHWSSRAGR